MQHSFTNIDVNALPVHLFVKSPKQAKKISGLAVPAFYDLEPVLYTKTKRFYPQHLH